MSIAARASASPSFVAFDRRELAPLAPRRSRWGRSPLGVALRAVRRTVFALAGIITRADLESSTGAELLALSDQLAQKGKIKRALFPLEVLAERDVDDPKLVHRLADLERKLGRLFDARGSYRRAAELYSRAGAPQKAAAMLLQILHLAPDQVDVRLELARLYEATLRGPEAGVQYEIAVQILRGRGEAARAEPLLEKVQRLRPRLAISGLACS
jgi:tetratricopeptide (TPR) repeat protein